MKCSFHPNTEAATQCSQCKKPLCDQCAISKGNNSYICSRCVALKAARDAVEGIDQRLEDKESEAQLEEARKKKKSMIWVVFQWAILIVCISIIAIRIPKVISAFKTEKPIRYGTYATDYKTDQCIKNLWHISRLLQERKLPGKNIVCPESKMPYVITNIKGDTMVRCANPKIHGFSEIRASKRNPRPEIKR